MGVDRHAIEGGEHERIELQVARDAAQRGLVGRQRIDPAHHHVEDPLARRFAGKIVGRARQHLVVDHARERAEDRAFRRKQVAELRQS